MDINTGQIIESLKKQLENHKVDFDVSEVGEVIMVGDGVARVQGLENVLSSEISEFGKNIKKDHPDAEILISKLERVTKSLEKIKIDLNIF